MRFSPDAALVGYHQEAERELRLDYCAANGIEVNRRVTGGGALLFQESSLGWELIAPWGEGPLCRRLQRRPGAHLPGRGPGLSSLGVEACFRPRNDIEVDGRKISGTGGMVLEGGAMFQGTVLVVNEIDRFLRALGCRWKSSSAGRSSRSWSAWPFWKTCWGGPCPWPSSRTPWPMACPKGLGLSLEPGGLTEGEREELAQRLPYFRSEEWLQAQIPALGAPGLAAPLRAGRGRQHAGAPYGWTSGGRGCKRR